MLSNSSMSSSFSSRRVGFRLSIMKPTLRDRPSELSAVKNGREEEKLEGINLSYKYVQFVSRHTKTNGDTKDSFGFTH